MVVVSIGVFTVDWLLRVVRSLAGKKSDPAPLVLAYHSVSDQDRPVFARQMDELARWTKSWESSGGPPNGHRRPLVTFDDGLQNVVENALPELAERGLAAAVFVVAGTLGTTANWTDYSDGFDPEISEPILTAEQLRKLPPDLVEIGSHTVTHPMMPVLTQEQARAELSASRKMLEGIIGKDVKLFSFPYGSANADLLRWCREEGYEQIFITYPSTAMSKSSGVVARVKVDPYDWPLEFTLKLHGAYRWRNRWRDCWK